MTLAVSDIYSRLQVAEISSSNAARRYSVAIIFTSFLLWSGTFWKFVGIGGEGLLSLASPLLLIVFCIYVGVSAGKLYKISLYYFPVVALAFVSSLWSSDVAATISKTISLTVLLISVAILFSAFDRPMLQILRALSLYGLFHSGLSLAMIALGVPSAFLGHDHLVGVVTHKTTLTNISLLCALASFYIATGKGADRLPRVVYWTSFLLSVIIVAIGGGGQAIAGLAFAAAVVLLLSFRAFTLVRVALIGAFLMALLLPFLGKYYYIISDITGKDVNITGRTVLWDYAIQRISESPLLGYGFFNVGETYEFISWQLAIFPFLYGVAVLHPHLHNQWLEIFYMMGMVGICVFGYVMVLRPVFLFNSRSFDMYGSLPVYAALLIITAFDAAIIKNTMLSFVFFAAVTGMTLQSGSKRSNLRSAARKPVQRHKARA